MNERRKKNEQTVEYMDYEHNCEQRNISDSTQQINSVM